MYKRRRGIAPESCSKDDYLSYFERRNILMRGLVVLFAFKHEQAKCKCFKMPLVVVVYTKMKY